LGLIGLIYLRTMPPGLVGIGRGLWDSQETQAVGLTWGYLHPPGYPLESLLANLLAHSLGALPGVEPGWGVTFLSVVAMVLAAGLVYHIVVRLTGNYVAALLAMVVFAFSPGPWHTAITPEVYGLNIALWALVFWLTLHAAEVPRSGVDFWLGLAMGLAAGHHRTAFVLVLAAILYLGMHRNWSLAWGQLLLGMCLSAAVYLYLPLAHVWRSPMTPGDATSLRGFWELVSARTWSVFFQLPVSVGELISRLEIALDALADQLGLAGSGLGLLGLAWLFSRRPARLDRLMLLGLPIMGLLVFAIIYQVPDVATMLGPLILILCVGLGGLAAGGWNLGANVWRRVFFGGLRSQSSSLGYHLSAVLLVAVAGGGLLVRNYTLVDESGDRSGQAVIAELACELSGTPGETWLTAESGYAGPLVTYIGQRIGRPLVWANPWGEWDYLGALAEGKRVFLVNDMPGGWQYPEALKRLVAPYRYLLPTGSPDLLELVVEPPYSSVTGQGHASSPLPLDLDYVELDQPFGSAILLRGYAWRICHSPDGQLLRLTLYWQSQAQVDQDWRVKAHLIGSGGALLAQADSEHPVRGAQPTSSWQPGQMVRDVHDFHLPSGADLQSAHAVVGLYQIADDRFPSLAEIEIDVREER
jgi:hypothetical protein